MTSRDSLARLGAAVSAQISLAADVDFSNDLVSSIGGTWLSKLSIDCDKYSKLFELLASDVIHPEDKESFVAFCRRESVVGKLSGGERHVSIDARCSLEKNGVYEWFSVSFLPPDPDSGVFDGRAVLLFFNIERQKGLEKRAAALSVQVELDALTGLYNQKAAQTLIDQYLTVEGRNSKHTILLCDLDNFKAVNDNFGHPFGDALLTDVADKFGSTFRRGDIACRIGGDEFVVFMKNTAGRSYVARRAERLLEQLKQSFPLGDRSMSLSVSIGIASYPENGTSYSELFASADRAMYCAKTNGKNQFRFYDETLSQGEQFSQGKNFDAVCEERGVHSARGKISDYIFKCLYEADDLEKTLPLVLQLMGTHFNLSCVFFSEITGESSLVVTKQWTSCGISPIIQPIEYSGKLRSLFESSRSANDLLLKYTTAQGIPAEVHAALGKAGIDDINAILQCPLLDEGVIKGYISFCDCFGARCWTKEESETLGYVSKLISMFLFKRRAHEHTLDLLELNKRILDSSPVMMYIVDPETYNLLYVSKAAADHVPDAREGRKCYSVFQNYASPCPFCPINGWRAQGKTGTFRCDIYSDHLSDWTESSATGIRWINGKEACLCGCFSIAKYKVRELELEEETSNLRSQLKNALAKLEPAIN